MPKLTVKKRRQPVKKHDKQHDARAASFLRIAKDLRREANYFTNQPLCRVALKVVAHIMQDEAKLLRSLR